MRNDIREETGSFNLDSALLDLIRETKRRSPDKYKRAMRLAKNGLHTERMADDFVNLITRSTGGSYTEKQWRSLMASAKRRYGKLHGRIATRRRASRDADKYIVILVRGAKGEKVWEDKTKARAQERADSLAELHGISLGMIQERDNVFIVDASSYYSKSGVPANRRNTAGDRGGRRGGWTRSRANYKKVGHRVGSGYEAFKLFQQKNGKGFLLHKASRTKNGWAILVSTTKNRNARRAYEVSRSGKITFGVKKWSGHIKAAKSGRFSAKKARNRKNARSFGKIAKAGGWKWDRKIQAYRRVSRDMSSELRGYSLQALGRMLRRAINQGDEHKARLIEQEIDRRSRR